MVDVSAAVVIHNDLHSIALCSLIFWLLLELLRGNGLLDSCTASSMWVPTTPPMLMPEPLAQRP
jgi:hypothetical protein